MVDAFGEVGVATRPSLAREDSDSSGELQQLPSLLLGYGVCAPALHGIRINLFVVHFPHHRYTRKVSSCHHSVHPIFKSTKFLQSKTGDVVGQVA